jgi:hypothetical protein
MYSYIKKINTNSIFGTNDLFQKSAMIINYLSFRIYDVLIAMEEP